MREWGLNAGLSHRLAADARLTVPSYVDDQIWELSLGGGALALETNYGRRARNMRIFPGFRVDQNTWIDSKEYDTPPRIQSQFPNYIRLSFEPFAKLNVIAEVWVKESNLIGGRYSLYNASTEPIQPELLLHAQLRPAETPQPMTSISHQGAIVLQGTTGDLTPLLFLSGGPRAAIAPFPALSVRPRLEPGASESYVWAHAACSDPQESFLLVRELMAVKWDAEIARIEQANVGLIEIETGDEEWDVALRQAQTISLGSFVGPTKHQPHASIVLERGPSRGYSSHPEGRDHALGWDGVALPDAYATLLQILPSAPELVKGVLLNFLATQGPDGSIDWKPGLGGQRSRMQCVPLLASLSLRTYLHTEDREFLAEVFPKLKAFVESWFQKAYDADQDGFPEWHIAHQSGVDDWPAYDRAHRWGQGLDIALAETPDLAAYLVKELDALVEIGRTLGETEHEQDLSSRQLLLTEVVERTWSEKQSCYLAQDRDLNLTVEGSRLGAGQGEFEVEIGQKCDPQIRLIVRVQGEESERRGLKIAVHGKVQGSRKRIYEYKGAQFLWVQQLGTLTTEHTFAELKKIVIRGPGPEVKTEVRAADYSRPDNAGLLPLWAKVPEKERAVQLVRASITNGRRYWREFGIPSWPADGLAYRYSSVRMRPNLMIGEGLVEYGFLAEAVELVERLMKACLHALREDAAFREAYYADKPGGIGKLGHSSGVAPLSLLLDVLGVRLISPHKVALRGHNPFKRLIRLRHRGIEITWSKSGARIVFPDGAEIDVTGREVQVVEQVSD